MEQLEQVNLNLLPQMLQMINQTRRDQIHDQKEATYNFKVQMMDPNRTVAKLEAAWMRKNRMVKKKQKLKWINSSFF